MQRCILVQGGDWRTQICWLVWLLVSGLNRATAQPVISAILHVNVAVVSGNKAEALLMMCERNACPQIYPLYLWGSHITWELIPQLSWFTVFPSINWEVKTLHTVGSPYLLVVCFSLIRSAVHSVTSLGYNNELFSLIQMFWDVNLNNI